jgi:hypothetical protein
LKKGNPYRLRLPVAVLQLLLLLQLVLPTLHLLSHERYTLAECNTTEGTSSTLCKLLATQNNTPLTIHTKLSLTGIYLAPDVPVVSLSAVPTSETVWFANPVFSLTEATLSLLSPPPQFL